MTVRLADAIVCSGRRHDDRGRAVGAACGRRAHPGCWDCEVTDRTVLAAHARTVVSAARAAGWKLGDRAESGAFPFAMCPRCGSPEGGGN